MCCRCGAIVVVVPTPRQWPSVDAFWETTVPPMVSHPTPRSWSVPIPAPRQRARVSFHGRRWRPWWGLHIDCHQWGQLKDARLDGYLVALKVHHSSERLHYLFYQELDVFSYIVRLLAFYHSRDKRRAEAGVHADHWNNIYAISHYLRLNLKILWSWI